MPLALTGAFGVNLGQYLLDHRLSQTCYKKLIPIGQSSSSHPFQNKPWAVIIHSAPPQGFKLGKQGYKSTKMIFLGNQKKCGFFLPKIPWEFVPKKRASCLHSSPNDSEIDSMSFRNLACNTSSLWVRW